MSKKNKKKTKKQHFEQQIVTKQDIEKAVEYYKEKLKNAKEKN